MANVQSVGYSDLFVLSKDDLWNAIDEFPDAKQRLIDAGRKRIRELNKDSSEVGCYNPIDIRALNLNWRSLL